MRQMFNIFLSCCTCYN